jgi:hypothetical protein
VFNIPAIHQFLYNFIFFYRYYPLQSLFNLTGIIFRGYPSLLDFESGAGLRFEKWRLGTRYLKLPQQPDINILVVKRKYRLRKELEQSNELGDLCLRR